MRARRYFEIAEFAEEKKLGVVLGWVRPSDTEPIQVNPSGKNTKVRRAFWEPLGIVQGCVVADLSGYT